MPDANLLTRIHNSYDQLTKREKYVADFVLAQPKLVLTLTITDLADRCGVGDTTVFRFCRSLRLSGYQDFKMSLALSTHTLDMLDNRPDTNVALSNSSGEIAQRICDVYHAALNAAYHRLDLTLIDQTVDMLLKANMIYVYGFGGSGIAAMMMQNKFCKLISNMVYCTDSHLQLTTAALLRPGDMCVVFCNSGITIDCIRIAQLAKEAGAFTVFATSFEKTPAAEFSDVVLPCGAAEGPVQGGSISVLSSQLFTIDVLYAEFFRRMGDEAKKHKERTAQAIVHKML